MNIPRGSIDYVRADVTGDVELSMPAEVALSRTPGTYTWLPATWEGDAGTERRLRTTDVVDTTDYPERSYGVFVRLTDNSEAPIIDAGTITIT